MNRKFLFSAIMALTLAGASGAMAQGNSHRSNNSYRNNDNVCRDGPGRCGNDYRWQDDRGRQDNGRRPRTLDERGAGPDRAFHRGDRLPYQYRTRQYVVEDWRGHRLSAPPRGYHWVQTGGDYVLVAIATGVILQLLLNN